MDYADCQSETDYRLIDVKNSEISGIQPMAQSKTKVIGLLSHPLTDVATLNLSSPT